MIEFKYDWILNKRFYFLWICSFLIFQLMLLILFYIVPLFDYLYTKNELALIYNSSVNLTANLLTIALIIFYLISLTYDLKHHARFRLYRLSLWKVMLVKLIPLTLLFSLSAASHQFFMDNLVAQLNPFLNPFSELNIFFWIFIYGLVILNCWTWFSCNLRKLPPILIYFILFIMNTVLLFGIMSTHHGVVTLTIGFYFLLLFINIVNFIFGYKEGN